VNVPNAYKDEYMTIDSINNIVIVGGGTAGWMTAAALSKMTLGKARIRVVESDEIGIVGVGEATIPHINSFNHALGIDEDEFLRSTRGTFKLGIEFVNWGKLGDRYIHGFGQLGRATEVLPFHHFWLRQHQQGTAERLEEYSINTVAPRFSKFMRPRPDLAGSPLSEIGYAFHFDASLYAKYLRSVSETRGVIRTEGKIVEVIQDNQDGKIEKLRLESGQIIEGDFFIDCSGLRGLLIEQTLKSGYEDWSEWLPCDRAWAVPCESVEPLIPITRSTAHSAGWQWRIPLQHRIGNGHVFSSRFMQEEEAKSILMTNLDGKPLAEPKLVRFQTGMRKNSWTKNCVAVGLASGFLEPLESTSIHLIQTAISRIIRYFPNKDFSECNIEAYNRETKAEYEFIRDFLILHYKATQRNDSPFWNYCRTMEIPESLQKTIALFKEAGHVCPEKYDLFSEVSWVQVMIGQGIIPDRYHPFIDVFTEEELSSHLKSVQAVISRCVEVMPTHAQFVAENCMA
jgi:tryptophan halogenase